jgi:hypothetical protein
LPKKPASDDPPDPKAKPDPKISSLEGQLAEMKETLRKQSEATQAAENRARDERGFNQLKTALAEHVRPEALEIAARDLFLAQKRVSFDEQGSPLLTVKRAPFAGQAEEDVALPLGDGVAHWLKTSEAKLFLPAPGGGDPKLMQRGPRAGHRAGPDGMPVYEQPATTDAERVRRAQERSEILKQKYPDIT